MRILRLISVLWFCGFSAFSQSQSTPSSDAIWIDVRTEAEFNESGVEGTYNITHTEIADRISEITTDLDAPIQLFCRSGVRAGKARKVLLDLGYTNVTNEGGYIEVGKKLGSNIHQDN